MIIKNGSINGVKTKTRIKCNNKSPFEGLMGEVYEIRTGKDRDIEDMDTNYIMSIIGDRNIYPKNKINKIEQQLSEIYDKDLIIDDVDSDEVILGKDEFDVIRKLNIKRKKKSKYYKKIENSILS